MTADEAVRKAKKGELLPFYLVIGEEHLLRDRVLQELRAASLGSGVAAFNEDRFIAGEADVDKVLAAARTVPMMAPRRFVLVRSAERWDAGDGDERREAPLDRLAAYAADPVPSTCLVVAALKVDGRRKLVTSAKKQGFLVSCEPLDARALPIWILEQATQRGHPMDREVAELLAEIAGPDLSTLNDALERLSLFVGPNAPIGEDAVGECVARVRTADTWALVDAVGAKDLARALRLLAEVYDPRDRGLPLLGAVAWSVRQIARYAAATQEGASSEDAAREAGVFQPYRARELAAKARTFRPRELERWLLVLAEADLALKGSRRPADAVLEDMLTRLCRR